MLPQTAIPPHQADRSRAYPIALLGGPTSPEAHALVDHLLQTIIVPANTALSDDGELKPPRPSSVARMKQAAGALLADLFDYHRAIGRQTVPRRGAHGMSKTDFPARRLGFGYDIFQQVVGPMVAAGLLSQTMGTPRLQKVFDRIVNLGGVATTFGLTAAVLDLARSFGIETERWADHWRRTDGRPLVVSRDTPRLILRTASKRVDGKKIDPVDKKFDHGAPEVQAILHGIDQLNGYLGRQTIGGIAFPGLRRIFNNGDKPDFAWNKGGRYYSLPGGHFYETWNADMRRQDITINGEVVEEVDLRASHLTLLHGLLRQPFDANDDPYEIGDWPRAVVKAWVSQAIGASNPRPFQWSDRSEDEYEAQCPGRFLGDEFPIREVGAEVTARHPLLSDLRVCGLSALDLQFHEAEILRAAMEDLMLMQDIPVLPIHDALIVARSRTEEAEAALLRSFGAHVERVTGQPSLAIAKVTTKEAKVP